MFETLFTNRALWEGTFLDLWTVPHVLSGLFFVLILWVLKFNVSLGLVLSFFFAALWEGFEIVTGIAGVETWTNQVMDILFAQIGFLIGWFILKKESGEQGLSPLWAGLGVLYFLALVLGWVSYFNYSSIENIDLSEIL